MKDDGPIEITYRVKHPPIVNLKEFASKSQQGSYRLLLSVVPTK